MASLTVPLPGQVRPRTAEGHQNAVDAAVRLLRGPDSLWPVDTGRSKRAWRRIGQGWAAQIFNPLRYASYVEQQNRRPARRTLRRHISTLRRAARREGTQPAEPTRTAVVEAFLRRAALEQEENLYALYLANRRLRGRAPRIPAALRTIDRRIRRRATR